MKLCPNTSVLPLVISIDLPVPAVSLRPGKIDGLFVFEMSLNVLATISTLFAVNSVFKSSAI